MLENIFFSPLEQALLDSRMVQISGGVDSKLAAQVNRWLMALEKLDSKKPIYMLINSPGGEITSGFSIYDTARFIEAPVYTVVTGLAASMGSLIALCAPKERRFSMPNAKFLIHQPLLSGGMYGSASEIEIQAKEISRTKEKINRLYAKETGRTYEELISATDRDNWMHAEEALKFGLISRIITNKKELELSK